MTVKELKGLLEQYSDDMIVIMSRDSEGNGYSPLSSIEDGAYCADETWCGEFGLSELTEELEELGYSEEDIVKGDKAICLYSIN